MVIRGRYELDFSKPPLGAGAMGIVYRAVDLNLDQCPVALKTVKDISNPAILELFDREWKSIAKVHHDNIVRIVDQGHFEDHGINRPFIVMEFLDGVTLDKLIRDSSSKLTIENTLAFVHQVCNGLEKIHATKLVHRDLKPSNIFITKDNKVKIIDFGLVHLMQGIDGTSVKGTPLYMAPEQIDGKEPTALCGFPLELTFSTPTASFDQVAVPEPWTAELVALALVALFTRRRLGRAINPMNVLSNHCGRMIPPAADWLWRRSEEVIMQCVVMCLLFVVSAMAQQPALRNYGRLPLVFEPNQGQADSAVKFLARAEGGTLFLTEREAVLATRGATPVRMRLAGGGKPQTILGLQPTGGISNYFIGNDPAKWRTGIPHYGRVEYKSVYAGVDVVYYGNPQKLEYDLVVEAGANPAAIQVEYEGVESLRVDEQGDLLLKTATGELRQKRPRAYQDTASGRVEVEVGYWLKTGRRVGFELARYDAGRRLVIDPVLFYSTYLGGSAGDQGFGIAVDGSGNAYVTGYAFSGNFPTANPLQANNNGGFDAFVTKVNARGSGLVYSTYLGGAGDDFGYAIAVDGSGNAYVTGETHSANFPTANALQTGNGGGSDAFIAKINNIGGALLYSTYLGGSGDDYGYGIAVDGSGNAYVTGQTASTNFPVTNPLQGSNGGGTDAFVTKINPAGSVRLYSTYLGGGGDDAGSGIAVDGSGDAYVAGSTASMNFPTTSPLQGSNAGGNDAFVTKINAAGSALVYSTYLGGSADDFANSIAVDGSGNAYVTGPTGSTDFPTTSPLQPSFGGVRDAFVTKINAAGSARVYSTYLGGSADDVGAAIAVDGAGNAYVTGKTASTNFPTVNALQASGGGGTNDLLVTKINAAGSAAVYSTYLGGSGDDRGFGIAVDGSGNAYLTGRTDSTNFPTASPLQPSKGGGLDAFVLSISGNSAVAAFRDTSGAIEVTSELSTLLSSAGGVFASDPAVAQNANGDTFVVARDSSNALWGNEYMARGQAWTGWVLGGGSFRGTPSITVIPTGVIYFSARDASGAYWINSYTPGTGFGTWTNLGGAFATDPVMAASPGGSPAQVYVVGKDNFNAIWSTVYSVPGGVGSWQFRGAVVAGKPSVTAGTDNAAYIAIRDNSNSMWIGYQTGTIFNGWQPGGGSFPTDPQIAAAGGKVYVGAPAATGAVWYNTFNQGPGNNWVGWVNTGGVLSSVAAAASTGPQLFLTGRDAANQLWWYETPGAGWKFVGGAGVAAGPLAAGPR